MKKDDILKSFYRAQITEEIERCTDSATLDLIYRILTEGAKNAHKQRKHKQQ